ncbi:MAG: oligosaccharide flippase family protein [Nitrospirae bacterium]|nr:oligosaccharide flippase family protein [Nitrospirota bacterium]
MLWSLLGAAISKGASFGAQLVLGWLLSKEDFALYAITISWSTVVMALRNGGTQRLLIQKGAQYADLAAIYLKIALIFNLVGFMLLAIAAPFLSSFYQSPPLTQMVWILALTLPLGSASMIFQAKLSSSLEFAKIAKLAMSSAALRYTAMVGFALAGFGPISFVLPMILVAVFETGLGWYWAGGLPASQALTWPIIRGILRDARWIMLTALAGALALNGDYLAISLLQSKEVLGVYFFGFQLSLALVALITSSLDAVLLPSFSLLSGNSVRQEAIFHRGVRLMTIGATFACFALLIGAEPLIHYLWAGKWDSAIPVVQLLSLTMPVRLIIPICRSILEARGEWRVVSLLFMSDGIGIIVAGAVGAWWGSLFSIAAVVSGYNLIFTLFYCGSAAFRLRTPIKNVFAPIGQTFGIGLIAVMMCFMLGSLGRFDMTNPWQGALLLAVYCVVYAGLTRLFLRESFSDLISLASGRISESLH